MKRIYTFILMIACIGMVQAQTWNFKSVPTTDAAQLNADTQHWTYDSTNDRWNNVGPIDGPLTANGTELSYAQGLTFHVTADGGLRPGSKRLALNNAATTMTIPNAQAGYTVEISWASSSGTTTRALGATNLTFVNGVDFGTKIANTESKTTATVTADGDVTFSCPDGALYIYSLKLTAPGAGDPDATLYSTSINPKKAQMNVALASGDVKFYDIDALDSVIINDGHIRIQPKTGNSFDQFTNQQVSKISYHQAAAPAPAATWTNGTGIQVIQAMGWQESAMVEFAKWPGAKRYHVYANNTKIDDQLIRDYGNYVRADAVGLAAGTYILRIVAIDANDAEIAASDNTVSNVVVVNYDRRGYAHFGNYGTGVGAYKDDGTLKANAEVLYVTSDNFNTISLTLPKDNKGGTETYVGLGEIFKALQKGFAHNPICVRMIGKIDRNRIDATQLLSDQGSLLLKGNNASIVMEVTIEGIGNDCWMNMGMGFVNGTNIEVRNIGIGGHPKAKDCIEVKGSEHIWIHNLDFFYAEKGSGDQVKGDGTLDAKDDCSYATFAYNHYFDCGKANLCGMKSEHTTNLICYHHNWFDHSDSRHPRVRTSSVHVWNNYYDGIAKYGIGATMGSSIFSECNFFRNTKYPMLASRQGRDAEGDGTFSGENGGIIKSYGNLMVERGQHFACYTQNTPGYATNFDCYEVANVTDQIPSSVVTVAGGTSYNNFDTDASTMYAHTADNAMDVPGIVTGFYGAGRMQHGDISYTFNNAVDDLSADWNDALWAVVSSYTPRVIGIVDEEPFGTGTTGGGETGGGETGGGETGDSTIVTPPSETAGICHFTGNAPSLSLVTVNGNYSNSKGTVTYGGETYSICVKMESSTQVTVTPTQDGQVTFIFGGSTAAGGKKIKINGEQKTLDANGQYTESATAGTPIVLTKGDSINLFVIVVE